MNDIFISCRSNDKTATSIYQELKRMGYDPFYIEVLRSGMFNDALLENVRSCKDFILILFPGSLDRCYEENDWFRLEIAEALKSGKNIVPVLMKGFSFPEKLPEDIDAIRNLKCLFTTTEYYDGILDRMCINYLQSVPRKATWPLAMKFPTLIVLTILAFIIFVVLSVVQPKHSDMDSSVSAATDVSAEVR